MFRKTVIFAVLALLFLISAHAEVDSGTCGGSLTWTVDTEAGTLVIAGSGTMTDYSASNHAPWYAYKDMIREAEINGAGYAGAYMLADATMLESVSFSNSVTKIGNHAFRGCSSLTSIDFPESITNIGTSAFEDCHALTHVGLTERITTIGDTAFRNCRVLTEVTDMSSAITNRRSAFSHTPWLEENLPNLLWKIASDGSLQAYYGMGGNITVPSNVKYIDPDVFSTYGSYVGPDITGVVLQEGVQRIGSRCFRGQNSLVSLTVPSTLQYIGEYTFTRNITELHLTDLTKWIRMEQHTNPLNVNGYDSVSQVSVYLNGEPLTRAEIASGVTSIPDYRFCGVIGLEEVVFPSTLTKIGLAAFDNCTDLRAVTFSGKLATIGDRAFRKCPLVELALPETLTTIGASAFNGCRALNSVTLPDSVTSLGAYAFGGCSSVTEVVLSNGLTTIVDGAFAGCPLTSIVFPQSLEEIGRCSFSGIALRTLSIPAGTRRLGIEAFSLSNNLEQVTIPSSVTSIGNKCFAYCSKLSIVNMSDTLMKKTDLGGAFFHTPWLEYEHPEALFDINSLNQLTRYNGCFEETVVVPDYVEAIGDDAFKSTPNMKKLVLSGKLANISAYAITGCDSLEEVDMGGVTGPLYLGLAAFRWCTNLRKVTMPFTTNYYYAFTTDTPLREIVFTGEGSISIDRFKNLRCMDGGPLAAYNEAGALLAYLSDDTELLLPESITAIADGAFAEATNLERVWIPVTVSSIGENAFGEALTDVYYEGTESQYHAISLAETAFASEPTVHFLSIHGLSDPLTLNLPAELVTLDGEALMGTAAEVIVIPAGVRSIGADVFANCPNLRYILNHSGLRVIAPEGVIVVYDY